MKPTILAIETASERCSVALHHRGNTYERESEQPRGHADLILPMIGEVLSEADLALAALDALAFSKGPGAFTSIRIGTSVIQGLALGADLKVAAASSLEIMAHKLADREGEVILPALDARMNEVYFGIYQIRDGRAHALQDDQVASPEALQLSKELNLTSAVAIGSGWLAYQAALAERFADIELVVNSEKYPHARDLMAIAFAQYAEDKLLTAEQILPVYIRDNVTHGS